jgi:hypothetical protein
MEHGGTAVNNPGTAQKLEELLGVKIVDEPIGEPEMTSEMEALLREFGLLGGEDESTANQEDAEADRQVAE